MYLTFDSDGLFLNRTNPRNDMEKQILTLIKFLTTGMIEDIGFPTLRNVERIIGTTFRECCNKDYWKPFAVEADRNSPDISKAAVLAHVWAAGHGAPKELQIVLEELKRFVLRKDEGYQKRMQFLANNHTYCLNQGQIIHLSPKHGKEEPILDGLRTGFPS